jgi:hypothetical protein
MGTHDYQTCVDGREDLPQPPHAKESTKKPTTAVGQRGQQHRSPVKFRVQFREIRVF